MPKYYNKGSGSLAIQLNNGKSVSLAGKTWTEIAFEDEACEDLIRALKKGFVARFDDTAPPVAAPAAPEEVAVAAVAAESLPAEETKEDLPSEEVTEKTPENTSSRRRKW